MRLSCYGLYSNHPRVTDKRSVLLPGVSLNKIQAKGERRNPPPRFTTWGRLWAAAELARSVWLWWCCYEPLVEEVGLNKKSQGKRAQKSPSLHDRGLWASCRTGLKRVCGVGVAVGHYCKGVGLNNTQGKATAKIPLASRLGAPDCCRTRLKCVFGGGVAALGHSSKRRRLQ